MKQQHELFPFGPDPSWYEKYWYGEKPARSFDWAKLLFQAIGKLRRSMRQDQVRPARQARWRRVIADRI